MTKRLKPGMDEPDAPPILDADAPAAYPFRVGRKKDSDPASEVTEEQREGSERPPDAADAAADTHPET